jgi:RNA polymerase sigma-70 factor (ECF subfamily)
LSVGLEGHDEREEPIGDRSFPDLYQREFAAVFRAVYALTSDRALAEDAAQEAFARALARWRRLAGEPWAAGWIMATALNVARRSLRRRPLPPLQPGSGTDPEEVLDIRAAIRALPRRQQAAVVLYYLADLTVADVANVMGCREGTVRAHLAKARAALARSLGAQEASRTPTREEGHADA